MKAGIAGSGFVGATAACALVMQGVDREIALADKNAARAPTEADDIRHAVPFADPLQVRSGDYDALAGCRVVVLCTEVGQKPGEARLQLLQRNARVFREVVPSLLKHAPNAVLAMKPVDVMTHPAARFAAERGVAPGRVLGSETTLDTARFRTLPGTHCGVDPHYVHACVIGGKGATYYGIGCALARIAGVILHDQRSILMVCAPAPEVVGVKDVMVALPRVVGSDGVLEAFPLPLNESESSLLHRSAQIIREALDGVLN